MRHSSIWARSSPSEFGTHPVARHYNADYTFHVTLRVSILIELKNSFRLRVRVWIMVIRIVIVVPRVRIRARTCGQVGPGLADRSESE